MPPEVTAELIRAGAKLNARSEDAETPLRIVACDDNPAMSTALPGLGAD